MYSRREFIKTGALTAAGIPITTSMFSACKNEPNQKLHVSIFSKHLQFLDYTEMAKMAAEIGFDGVDLTVRPKGHVLPEKVEQDLPRAIEAMEKAGLKPLMMASGVRDAENPVDRTVLQTAAGLGMKYYRMAYFRYTEDGNIPDDIVRFQKQAQALGDLSSELGLIGCYQNHAGNYVGASMFELFQIFKEANDEATGLQYDIRHATVEGGRSWETGLRLVHQRIKTIALKDFRWEQIKGKWETVNVPMGEGMVDFHKYFALLKKYKIMVPASLHLEYPIGGAEHGDREVENPEVVYAAMRRDLEYVHKAWSEA